ncbi:MAG TPA: hypothetical protein VH476_11980 [Solirubrobacterales bacterium]
MASPNAPTSDRDIIVADLELDALESRKRLIDVAGHYNRPDVFRLLVDDSVKPAIALARLNPEG